MMSIATLSQQQLKRNEAGGNQALLPNLPF
jgi:hypothetical protein